MKIGTILILTIIFLCGVFLTEYLTPDVETIDYPDGCREVWVEGELQSKDLCNEGRAMTQNEMQDLQ